MARTRRRRGVRVRRQVRRIELWPLAKLAFAFHLVSAITTLLAGVLLFRVGDQAELIDRLASLLRDIGFSRDFTINGEALFRAAAPALGALVLLATVGTVLAGALFNVVSGLFGGLVFSVLEDRSLVVRSDPSSVNGSTGRRSAESGATAGGRAERPARASRRNDRTAVPPADETVWLDPVDPAPTTALPASNGGVTPRRRRRVMTDSPAGERAPRADRVGVSRDGVDDSGDDQNDGDHAWFTEAVRGRD
jgi:hypothetical protein